MSIFKSIMGFLGGGSGIVEAVTKYFPPSMSEEDKKEFTLRIKEADNQNNIKLLALANQEQALFEKRMRDMEGTAKDLKTIPILGPIIIFLRGCLRPAFTILTMIWDYQVYSGTWELQEGTIENSFFLINALVLGFLFGERAFKNIAPIAGQYFGKNKNIDK